MSKKALLLVDLQNDFFPGGALPVSGANALFPLANDIQDYFELIIASKDWHPKNHGSFASNHPERNLYEIIELKGLSQILWPEHCIQNTFGAEFHPKLQTKRIQKIVFKGSDPNYDSYSAFFDNGHILSTDLDLYLTEMGVTDLYIMGLATDYCVLYSAMDALKLGLNTFVILDGCYGINQKPGDVEAAIESMKKRGAIITHSQAIKSQLPKIIS